MRRVRVEVDEIRLADLGLPGRAFEPQGSAQLPLMVVVELRQNRDRILLLRQHTLGRHLSDVGRGKIHPVVEAVLELRQFDPLRVDGGDYLVELLLRGDDDPARCDDLTGFQQVLADLAKLLDSSTQVFDLVTAAGDVLPHLVDDEDQCLAGAATTGKLERPLDDLADRDRRLTARMRPRICRGIGRRIEVVQHGTGTCNPLGTRPDDGPVSLVEGLAEFDEILEPPFRFEFDLQFGDVPFLGIAEFPEKDDVHQLSDPLRDPSGVLLLGDLEKYDLGRDLGVDQVQEVSSPFVIQLPLEEPRKVLTQNLRVLQSITEVLGERTLTGAEEARDPDAYAFVRLSRCFGDSFEQHGILVPDAVRRYVLAHLRVDRLLVGLVDLDDLFDPLAQIPG